jgi:hypothetical protein
MVTQFKLEIAGYLLGLQLRVQLIIWNQIPNRHFELIGESACELTLTVQLNKPDQIKLKIIRKASHFRPLQSSDLIIRLH